MDHSSSFNRSEVLRYLFWGFWFFLLPAVAAYGLIDWLSNLDVAGPLDDAARGQSVPSGIVAFTVLEGLLLHFRHHLPLSGRFSEGGRIGLDASDRKRFEAARHLSDDVKRILSRHEQEVADRLGSPKLSKIRDAMDELQAAMTSSPFEPKRFESALDEALEVSGEDLAPWRKGELREYAESIGVAIVVALLLRAVVVEAFKIPSGSMLPTLQIGDHIFVSKFAYGPTLPLTKHRVLSDLPPKRGDVIVFEYPDPNLANERQDYIKRVVAVPGDILEADGGHPIINGWRVPNCRVGDYQYGESDRYGRRSAELYMEFLGETAFLTLYNPQHFKKKEGPFVVKPGEVWVMGDNRDNSLDSRAWERGGKKGAGVPYANIKGRAMIVWFPLGRILVNVMGQPVLPEGASPEILDGVARCLADRPPTSRTLPPDRTQPGLTTLKP